MRGSETPVPNRAGSRRKHDPGESNGPVQLDAYVQLRKNNANYGQPSEIGLVTVNP